MHNDYWCIQAESGLIDFICFKLRDKYSIKILDYSKDYVSGEVLINKFDTMSLDTHKFYD